MEINLLDCTLRDGGYVNNWNFACDDIKAIISSLVSAGVEFVECGFLKMQGQYNSTLFDGIKKGCNPLVEYIKDYPEQKFTLMFNAGEFDVESLLKEEIPDNIYIRIAFRKNLAARALQDAELLLKNGIKVFVNPMFTNIYTETELNSLLEEVNRLKPYALCITDTAGGLIVKNTIKLVKFIDKKLERGIAIDFHSHNNLNLSFSNASAIAGLKLRHNLILDCCISGMGRGAGNLNTVDIAKYLGRYNVGVINKGAGKIISDIYKKIPWGLSYALYQSGRLVCHPDYAIYLENSKIKHAEYKKLLSSLPEDFKYKYNKTAAENLLNM